MIIFLINLSRSDSNIASINLYESKRDEEDKIICTMQKWDHIVCPYIPYAFIYKRDLNSIGLQKIFLYILS